MKVPKTKWKQGSHKKFTIRLQNFIYASTNHTCIYTLTYTFDSSFQRFESRKSCNPWGVSVGDILKILIPEDLKGWFPKILELSIIWN